MGDDSIDTVKYFGLHKGFKGNAIKLGYWSYTPVSQHWQSHRGFQERGLPGIVINTAGEDSCFMSKGRGKVIPENKDCS